MKKIILMFAVMAIAFTGCSSNDNEGNDTSKFVGSWEATMDYVLENDNWVEDYEYEEDEFILTFTETHVTINDASSLLNGQTVAYTYKDNKISLEGIAGAGGEVLSVTDTELVLSSVLTELTDEGTQTYTMKTVYVKR